jgi:hypothetical protein
MKMMLCREQQSVLPSFAFPGIVEQDGDDNEYGEWY